MLFKGASGGGSQSTQAHRQCSVQVQAEASAIAACSRLVLLSGGKLLVGGAINFGSQSLNDRFDMQRAVYCIAVASNKPCIFGSAGCTHQATAT